MIAEVEVKEEDRHEEEAGEMQAEDGEQEFDLVQQGRREEFEYTKERLQMFEFGSLQEAMSRVGKAPTTTKWVDRTKKGDDGKEFVRCRMVARDFKPKREGPRDDLLAAMLLLEAKKALFVRGGGAREAAGARTCRGEADVRRREESAPQCPM